MLAVLLAADSARAAFAPPGIASGGSPHQPSSQYLADKRDQLACSDNSLVIITARGSGAAYGARSGTKRDHTLSWYASAARRAIARGYRVRHLQVIYSAGPIPAPEIAEDYPLLLGAIKRYLREAETVAAAQVRLIQAAVARCPSRPIIIGGYSQGNIQLRRLIDSLPRGKVLDAIRSIDLISDPMASRRDDGRLQHPGSLGGRLTDRGLALVALARRGYRNYHGLNSRIYQYCARADRVCDYNGTLKFAWFMLIRKSGPHGRYGWAKIGAAAADRLPAKVSPGPGTPPPKRIRVTLGIGSQSVAVAGVDLTMAPSGAARHGAVADLVQVLGPWSSCTRLGKGGFGEPRASWPDGLTVVFGDLTNFAQCEPQNKAVATVHVDGPGWQVETEHGSVGVGEPLPAALAAIANRGPATSEGGTVVGELFRWPEQDACAPMQATNDSRMLVVVGFDSRVSQIAVSAGEREITCP